MLSVGQVIELTHGVTHQRAPHIVQMVSDGSARAVPLSYHNSELSSVPASCIAVISRESSVREYPADEVAAMLAALVTIDTDGNTVKRRGRPRKHPVAPATDPSDAPVEKRKRGRPRKHPIPETPAENA